MTTPTDGENMTLSTADHEDTEQTIEENGQAPSEPSSEQTASETPSEQQQTSEEPPQAQQTTEESPQAEQTTEESPQAEQKTEESPQAQQTTDESQQAEQTPDQTNGTTDHSDSQVNGVKSWPDRVTVSGPGLSGGVVGKKLDFFIDARKGGPGELTAFCAGPNRPAYCELVDHDNGTFTLTVKPEEIGTHELHAKYDGELVQGSPFTVVVTANTIPDPTKVRVTGPGVENGVLATFQSQFTVDTQGAGAGNLSVRMQGPRGAFRMEMRRASQSDRKILCHYNPQFTGVYNIIVKWSGNDVPGSPFHVRIFETDFEMERELQKQS